MLHYENTQTATQRTSTTQTTHITTSTGTITQRTTRQNYSKRNYFTQKTINRPKRWIWEEREEVQKENSQVPKVHKEDEGTVE